MPPFLLFFVYALSTWMQKLLVDILGLYNSYTYPGSPGRCFVPRRYHCPRVRAPSTGDEKPTHQLLGGVILDELELPVVMRYTELPRVSILHFSMKILIQVGACAIFRGVFFPARLIYYRSYTFARVPW